jgi:hypothetical protein
MQDLLLNQATYDALLAGLDPRRIAEDWEERLHVFMAMRETYLIYK